MKKTETNQEAARQAGQYNVWFKAQEGEPTCYLTTPSRTPALVVMRQLYSGGLNAWVEDPDGNLHYPFVDPDNIAFPSTILGKPVLEYLAEQFPATVGHRPLSEWFTIALESHRALGLRYEGASRLCSVKAEEIAKLKSEKEELETRADGQSVTIRELRCQRLDISNAVGYGAIRACEDLDSPAFLEFIQNKMSASKQKSDVFHEFKNFHKRLCEKVGMEHDNEDWRMDLISLVEQVGATIATANRRTAEARDATGRYKARSLVLQKERDTYRDKAEQASEILEREGWVWSEGKWVMRDPMGSNVTSFPPAPTEAVCVPESPAARDLIATLSNPKGKDLTEGADYDTSIHSNPNAQAWAKFFITTINEVGERIMSEKSYRSIYIGVAEAVCDEEYMIGWFANAMMAMHDYMVHKRPATPEQVEQAATTVWEALLIARESARVAELDARRAMQLSSSTPGLLYHVLYRLVEGLTPIVNELSVVEGVFNAKEEL